MSSYALLLFIAVSATFIYFPEKQRQQVTEALEMKAESTVQMLAVGISLALDEGDYDLIQKVFNLTQADTNIAYIAVLDEIGDEIISFNPKEIQTPNIIQYSTKKVFEEQEMIFVAKRLRIEDEIYGYLVIGYSLKGRNETIAQIRWTGFWISMAIFLLGTLISVYLSRQITKPIKNVVESLKEIGRVETYGKMIEKSSNDEIGSLIDGFNDMSAKIYTRTEELRLRIIEHKKAEEEKGELQEKLDRAERMESLGILAGGVAHDLNNTLVPLIAIPELMLSKLPKDSDLREHVMLIKRATKRAADTIGDLLTLARRGIYEMKPLNLNSLLDTFLRSYEFIHFQKQKPNVILESDFEKDLPNIMGSNSHLSQVVMNLVKNAFEAIDQGGRVSIKTSKIYLATTLGAYTEIKPGNYVLLEIEDDGIGISDDNLHKIFEPFYTDKEMGSSGSGLGLAVVWGVVKDHDAYIDVGTTLGSGAKFSVYFPVTDETVETFEDEPYDDRGTENILVVDDLEEQRETLDKILSSLGYHVDSVENGHLAVEFVEQHDIDIVVLDMKIEEDFDGLDTYLEIKKIKENQKVIIVSGFAENERVKEAMELGVGKFVRKPYTTKKLGIAIRQELDGK